MLVVCWLDHRLVVVAKLAVQCDVQYCSAPSDGVELLLLLVFNMSTASTTTNKPTSQRFPSLFHLSIYLSSNLSIYLTCCKPTGCSLALGPSGYRSDYLSSTASFESTMKRRRRQTRRRRRQSGQAKATPESGRVITSQMNRLEPTSAQ